MHLNLREICPSPGVSLDSGTKFLLVFSKIQDSTPCYYCHHPGEINDSEVKSYCASLSVLQCLPPAQLNSREKDNAHAACTEYFIV